MYYYQNSETKVIEYRPSRYLCYIKTEIYCTRKIVVFVIFQYVEMKATLLIGDEFSMTLYIRNKLPEGNVIKF